MPFPEENGSWHEIKVSQMPPMGGDITTHLHGDSEAPEGISRVLEFSCGLTLSCELIDQTAWQTRKALNALHSRHHENGHDKPYWLIIERHERAEDGLSESIYLSDSCDEVEAVKVTTTIEAVEEPVLMDWSGV
jgi:hypothetical protein